MNEAEACSMVWNVMNPWRYVDGVSTLVRGRGFVAGSMIVFSLLSCATGSHAQQGQPSQPRGSTVPTLEALPHIPMPRGDFLGWCGLDGKILLRVGRGTEIYNGGVKASPHSFPSGSTLQCDDDGQKLAFIDDDWGRVSEFDIPGGTLTRTLATYVKQLSYPNISFSSDLKRVASDRPLTLVSADNLKVLQLEGQSVRHVQWNRDSSEVSVISQPAGKEPSISIEVFNAQHQKTGSGTLPAGFLFRDGWFANSQTMYLYLGLYHDEFGAGLIFRCRIEGWKCEQIARNVLYASVGGDGILAMVRAIGKYSSDGDWTTYPSGYLAEIRNNASQVIARQTFKSAERNALHLTIAPSGMKAVFTWNESPSQRCPPEQRESDLCRLGINRGTVIDLSGIIK